MTRYLTTDDVSKVEGTGLITRTGDKQTATRSIEGAGGNVVIENPDGVGGDIRIRLSQPFLDRVANLESGKQPLKPDASSIISADWQPKTPEQVARLNDVLTEMATFRAGYSRPIKELIHFGDLINQASTQFTGLPPAYGYPELLASVASRRLPEFIMIPGNHDRDASGDNLHERNWSYETYKQFFGPMHYARIRGNVMWVLMGDMAGQTHGEQTDAALRWFEQTLNMSDGMNVYIGLHQPIYGTWGDSVADYQANGFAAEPNSSYQWYSERIATAIMARDNIAAVFYGHVGSSYALSTQIVEQFGTVHIGVQMGLERIDRLENGGATDWPNHYGVLDWTNGSKEVLFRRRDAKTANWIDGSTRVIVCKYPVTTGETVFDGRRAVQRVNPVIDKSLTVWDDLSSHRVETTAGTWETAPGIRWMITADLTETALDDAMPGHGSGILFRVPGSTTRSVDGNNITSEPSSKVGGGVAAVRTHSTDGEHHTNLELFGANPDIGDGIDSLVRIMRLKGEWGTADFDTGIAPLLIAETDDLNTIGDTVSSRFFNLFSWPDLTPVNAPPGGTHFTLMHMQTDQLSRCQLAMRRAGGGVIYCRNYTLGAWTAWRRLLTDVDANLSWQYVASGAGDAAWQHTGDTAEATILTLPAFTPNIGPKGILRVKHTWSTPNSNTNVKTPRLKMNGTLVDTVTLGGSGSSQTHPKDLYLFNTGVTNAQRATSAGHQNIGSVSGASPSSYTFDMTAPLTLTFTVQNANAADTCRLESYLIEKLVGPPA